MHSLNSGIRRSLGGDADLFVLHVVRIVNWGNKRRRGGTTNEERVKECLAILEANLDIYEQILAKQRYLAGDVRPSTNSITCNSNSHYAIMAGGDTRRSIPFAQCDALV